MNRILRNWATNGAMLLFMVLNTSAAQVVVPKAKTFTVTISATNAEVLVGDPIIVHVVLLNDSGETVQLATLPSPDVAGQHYKISVFDAEGRKVAPIGSPTDGNRQKEVFSGSLLLRVLPSGYSLEENATISDIYGMTKPETYRIQFEISLNGSEIKSNDLDIKVKPKAA